MRRTLIRIACCLALAAGSLCPAAAQVTDDDKDQSANVGELVVTGAMRVRQGGAQDIGHFRGEAASMRIPLPDTLTPEGLLGGYDLVIPSAKPCVQTFCLTGEAMRSSLLTRPEDRIFVGLGFGTDIQAERWRREPLNLVAVVDKSGSMNGEPLELVRQSLRQIVRQLKRGDQIAIVLYGDRSYRHLEPTPVDEFSRERILQSIDRIQSAGSTNMEEGLAVGYETAFSTADRFKGATRLMLFTDEQPNVGATDAESFMSMAEAASKRGVGLTTIGVGVQYDAALATRISSTRGGNLYFLRDKADVKEVFSSELDTMVSELAYDLKVTLTPHPGYRITGVYGVPGDQLEQAADGGVRFVVSTVFFSTKGGGVFLGLAKAADAAYLPEPQLQPDTPLVEAALTYVSALDGRQASDTLTVRAPAAQPGETMRLGHVLVDEFLILKAATTLFHEKSDEEGAYQLLRQLSTRLERAADQRLKPERQLVGALVSQTAYLSGHANEPPKSAKYLALVGVWEVERASRDAELNEGDRLDLRPDNHLLIYRKARGLQTPDEEEGFRANDTQLSFDDSDWVFRYRLSAERLTLTDEESGATVSLKRVKGPGS